MTASTYKAAAMLLLTGGGNYDVVQLYGLDPYDEIVQQQSGNECLNCTPTACGSCKPSCDMQDVREIEIGNNDNVYVVAASQYNDNDWILTYDASGTELARIETRRNANQRKLEELLRRLLGKFPTISIDPVAVPAGNGVTEGAVDAEAVALEKEIFGDLSQEDR